MSLQLSVMAKLFPHLPLAVGEDLSPANVGAQQGDDTPADATPTVQPAWSSPDEQQQQVEEMQNTGDLSGWDPNSLTTVATNVPTGPVAAQPPAIPGGGYVDPATTGDAMQPAQAGLMRGIQKDADSHQDDASSRGFMEAQMPDFSNLPPAQRAYQEEVWRAQHPVDQNHGFKGRVGEILSNFLYGMGQMQQQNPMATTAQLLGAGGIAGVAGRIVPTWNERRESMSRIPVLRQAATDEQNELYRRSQSNYYNARPGIEEKKIQGSDDRNMRTNLTRMYNNAVEFHDDDQHPDDKAMADAYEKTYGFRPPDKDAKTKSVQFGDEKTGEQYLLQTDAAGHEKVVKLLNDDGSPVTITDKAMLTSEDRQKQRDLQAKIADNKNITAVKVSEIGAGARKYAADQSYNASTQRTQMSGNIASLRSRDDAMKALAAIDAANAPAEKKQAAKAAMMADLQRMHPEWFPQQQQQ